MLILYLAIQTSVVQTFVVGQITERLSQKLNTNISIKRVDISFFNKLIFKGVYIEDQKKDTLLFIDDLIAHVDLFRLRKHQIHLSALNLRGTKAFVTVNEAQATNFDFIIEHFRKSTPSKDTVEWDISCDRFLFDGAKVGYSWVKHDNFREINLDNILLEVSGFKLSPDSVYFRINDLKFSDNNNINLQQLTAEFKSGKSSIELNNLSFLTNFSEITGATLKMNISGLREGESIVDSYWDLKLQESRLNLRDFAAIIPEVKDITQDFYLSGHMYGRLSELKAKQLSLKTGKNTVINCNVYLNGLPDLNQTFIQLDLNNSSVAFKDLEWLNNSSNALKNNRNLARIFNDAGIVYYNGNFTGFLSDFVAYGAIRSNYGRINTDLSFKPANDNSKKLLVNGHLKTVNFNLAKLAHSDKLGRLTFSGQIDGNFNPANDLFNANVKGKIDSTKIYNYVYKNIILDGSIQGRKFDGNVQINDEHLKCEFNGKIDTNPDSSAYNFELQLHKANLTALQLDKSHRQSDLAMHVNANFTGNNIDEIRGVIKVNDGTYINENDSILLSSLSFETFAGEQNSIQMNSDFADLLIEGNYHFNTLKASIENILFNYLPSSGVQQKRSLDKNKFHFNAEIKNLDPVWRIFYPQVHISPGTVYGEIDEKNNLLALNANIDRIQLDNVVLSGYSLAVTTNDKLEVKSRIDELSISSSQKLFNIAVLASAEDDELETKLLWNNFDELTYSGEIEALAKFSLAKNKKPHANIDVIPSRIYIADSLWQVNPARITIDSSRVAVNHLSISNRQQSISFDGIISSLSDDKLDVNIHQFNLENLNLILGDANKVSGMLNGTVSLLDLYNQPLYLSDVKLNRFRYNDTAIGDLSLLSKWDPPSQSIQAELILDDKNNQAVYGYGSYSPANDSIDFTINADQLSLNLLNTVLTGSFENVHGEATGEIKLKGGRKKLLMYGDIFARDAGLTLTYLQVPYNFTDFVKFRGDSIIFDKITVHDPEGNSGVFDGSIRHDNFANMDYNLTVRSVDLQVINTTNQINPKFYGKAYANGFVKITGHGQKVFLDGNARSLAKTLLNISLEYEEEAQEYDFIRFISHQMKEQKQAFKFIPTDQSAVFMNFNLTLTPDAHFQLVYNSSIGDVIRGQGSGSLRVKIDPEFNIEMYGDYQVERGDYLFTLKNVINKKFEIEQGGKIQWNGDPYDATIDINAIYRLKASLNELFVNSTPNIDYSQRIPVVCKIALKDQLTTPDIKFDIEFPSAEDRIKEEVKQFMSTEEDMNKQILSLLVMGRFYTPEYLRGSYESQNPNLVGTTASELFSNQLSNWLSQISNDFDIGVNYRPGNQITDDEIELALSTQFFNDRVTVNGNISNNANQSGTTNSNNSSNFVGDFDVNVKLTRNGKLQFKAYNHSNNNIIYETSPYKQGVGLSYRESYDTFSELWEKFIRLFKSKKAKH